MNNSDVIQTAKSADLVTHKVLVDGNELSKKYQVKQLVVNKEVNRIPTATLVLVDGDPSKRDFELSNESLLVPGVEVEITAGYHTDEDTIYKGIVIKHSLKIRDNSTLLIIECRDKAVRLTVGRKSKYFYESLDSEIFEEIIGGYELEHEIEATTVVHKELVQYHCSDWDFVVSRAQANGKLCFVEDGKMTVEKPKLDAAEVETVTFGATMLDFDAEIDARNQFDKISGYAWNPAEQEILEIEANNPEIQGNGNLSLSDLADTIKLDNLELRHGGALRDTQLQAWADAKQLFQQMAKIRGRVKFQGIPAVKPGVILKLQGVGDRFNGNVYVTGVKHQITEGNWTVDAQFGLNPKWFSETFDINPLPASGLLSAVSGLQVGIVSQLQEDPEGEHRILVRIPVINNKEQGIWCRVASLDAGENRGAFFLPEIEDEVIVGFINADPNDGVVLGMLHSSAKPAPIAASDANDEKGFFTRSEMKLIFDDQKKSIRIETPAGKIISLDEDAGSIVLQDENNNVFTLDSAGIALDSTGDIKIKTSGDISLEGMNINVKASANLKAEGAAGAEMSTSAVAVLKGSLVKIN